MESTALLSVLVVRLIKSKNRPCMPLYSEGPHESHDARLEASALRDCIRDLPWPQIGVGFHLVSHLKIQPTCGPVAGLQDLRFVSLLSSS